MSESYRIEVLLDDVTEATSLSLIEEIAELLVAADLAARDGEAVRALIALHPHTWTGAREPPGALHFVIPKAEPRSPDLGLGYSPN